MAENNSIKEILEEEAILKLPRFIKGTVFITLSVHMILTAST